MRGEKFTTHAILEHQGAARDTVLYIQTLEGPMKCPFPLRISSSIQTLMSFFPSAPPQSFTHCF